MDTRRRHANDDPSEERSLRSYKDDPMADGDALLLLDGTVCLELAGLANSWDDIGRRVLRIYESVLAGEPAPVAA